MLLRSTVQRRTSFYLFNMDKPVLPRIYLSPPHMSGEELELVKDAFASNWIAPLGPHVDAFEREMAEYSECPMLPRSCQARQRFISHCAWLA